MGKFGMLKRDNTSTGLGRCRMVLYVDHGSEKEAVQRAVHLHLNGVIAVEPVYEFGEVVAGTNIPRPGQ